MNYPIAIHKDKNSAYGVTVPDLPGCFSAGDSLDEALVMAREAILGHLETLAELGKNIPDPKLLEAHQRNPDYAGAIWAVVSVDTSNLIGKAVRINISMNERVLAVVDEYASRVGDTRSGLLQKAASQYVNAHASVDSRKRVAAGKKKARSPRSSKTA